MVRIEGLGQVELKRLRREQCSPGLPVQIGAQTKRIFFRREQKHAGKSVRIERGRGGGSIYKLGSKIRDSY